MTRAIALARTMSAQRRARLEAALRIVIVSGCALALTMAGRPLPF